MEDLTPPYLAIGANTGFDFPPIEVLTSRLEIPASPFRTQYGPLVYRLKPLAQRHLCSLLTCPQNRLVLTIHFC